MEQEEVEEVHSSQQRPAMLRQRPGDPGGQPDADEQGNPLQPRPSGLLPQILEKADS